MTGLDTLARCPQCRSADIVHVHWGVGGRFRCMQCGNRFNEAWVASARAEDWTVDSYARPDDPSDVQKMFILLSESRRCINDNYLEVAQQKLLAVESILKSATERTTGAVFAVDPGASNVGKASLRAKDSDLTSGVVGLAPPSPPSLANAAEMLWVVLANVSGGDWTQQTAEWQEAAARWRDNYFLVAAYAGLARPPQDAAE